LNGASARGPDAPKAKVFRKTAAENTEHEIMPHLVRLQSGGVILHECGDLHGTAPKIRDVAADHRVVKSARVK
jgi:hypothetical protein